MLYWGRKVRVEISIVLQNLRTGCCHINNNYQAIILIVLLQQVTGLWSCIHKVCLFFRIPAEITLVSVKPTIFHSLLLNTRTSSVQGGSLLANADMPNDHDLHKALHNKIRCRGRVVPVGAMKTYEGAEVYLSLSLILPRSHTGTVWFYTSTSNKRAARPKLYTKSLTKDLKRMYSRLTLVRISINL